MERPNDYVLTSWTPPIVTPLPTRAQLVALRDFLLEHNTKEHRNAAAAADNLLDCLCQARVREEADQWPWSPEEEHDDYVQKMEASNP